MTLLSKTAIEVATTLLSKTDIEKLFASSQTLLVSETSANVRRVAVFVKDNNKANVVVEFTRGGGYQYDDVDEAVVESLIWTVKDGGSLGSWVATKLKNKYKTTKIFSGVQD